VLGQVESAAALRAQAIRDAHPSTGSAAT
jgi:hypothetical protein